MLHKLKISEKFILSFIVITLGPLLTVAYLGYSHSKIELEKKIINSFIALNNARAASVAYQIQLRLEQAREIAGSFLTRQLAIDATNEPWLVHKMQGHVETIFEELKRFSPNSYQHIAQPTDIDSIALIDINGKIIVDTDKNHIGQNIVADYLEKVIERGTYFAGLHIDPEATETFLLIFEQIRHWETGAIAGAILLRVRGRVLNDITADHAGLGETGETYIVNRQGYMITDSRFLPNAEFRLKVNTPATQDCFTGKAAPSIYKGYRGSKVLGVQKYLPDQDWCLISEIGITEAFESVNYLRSRTLFLIGIVVVLILFFLRMMNHVFIDPIVDLRNAAGKVGRGDLGVKLPVPGKDELGELTQEFNQMTEHLKKDKEQLEQQKRDLEKVNKELDSFVYTASHDLRAPLRGIASFATFLEDDYREKLDGQGKDYVKEIREGAQRLSALIDDLLTLSQVSRIKNPYEQTDIKRVIEMVRQQLKFDIEDKNVEFKMADNLPVIACDPIKIKTVFLNLINNAIKFSGKDNKQRPKVEIGYNETSQDYRFFVKDNGIGIAPEFHEKVFDLFRKLHINKEYEGTGAGLSIVQRIIEDHGGRVWVESKEGQGAAFYFTIPKKLS
ncbi:MAG TPA: ATP-binding protein [Candidatus Omnitrophota bacterium]|nr:ATP-binding protein [Candidatus Omnitrophota bacterium]